MSLFCDAIWFLIMTFVYLDEKLINFVKWVSLEWIFVHYTFDYEPWFDCLHIFFILKYLPGMGPKHMCASAWFTRDIVSTWTRLIHFQNKLLFESQFYSLKSITFKTNLLLNMRYLKYVCRHSKWNKWLHWSMIWSTFECKWIHFNTYYSINTQLMENLTTW